MDEAEIEHAIGRIQELAIFVIEKFGPLSEIEFGLNRPSLEWVEGFIERERQRRDPGSDIPEGLLNTLGAFLGECIVAASGGKWEWHEQQQDWGIHFSSGASAFPFSKVWKQFKNGIEGGDSILSFYDVAVNYVALGKLP
jgi:hypothetical protein